MPYGKFAESGKVAVYKVDANKKKVGKRLGLHPDDKAANAQLAALNANEKKPKKEAVFISGDSTVVSATITGDIENPTATWKEVPTTETGGTETKDYYGNPVEVVLVESSCGPLTFADLLAEEEAREAVYEMEALNYKLQRLINNIMASDSEDKAGALVALTNEYADLVQKEIQDSEDKAASIAKQIAGDNQPKNTGDRVEGLGSDDIPPAERETLAALNPNPSDKSLFIWKEADTYRWLAAYSNNRRDEDNPPEIICSASHKEFDEALNNKEWPMPELWVWHVPMAVGQTLFHAYDEAKGFPIAGGVFNKGFEWVAEGLSGAGWDGVSHGMPSEWIQRDKEDPTVIIRHRTKEVSILPNWAAANKLAFTIISKENSMADETKDLPQHKRDQLVAAFGEDKAKLFESALADKAKAADEAQIEQKEAGEKTTGPTTADVVKGLEFIVEQLNALNDRVEARFKALEEATVKEEDQYDIVAQLRAKSVIGNPAAKVHGNSALAKDAPAQTQPETPTVAATGGVPIGLVDGLFQLNQGWYNRGGEQR